MSKRNNLVSTMCPICGYNYSLADFRPSLSSLESTFGYSEANFYGGKVVGFTKGKCCREYHLYWMKANPSYKLKDIEPVDNELFIRDLYNAVNGSGVELNAMENLEEIVDEYIESTEESEADKNAGSSVSGLKFQALKKYAKDTYDKTFENKAKRVDVESWLKENGTNGEYSEEDSSSKE